MNFGGIAEEKFSSFDNSRIIVWPVSYEGTVSYGGGTGKGAPTTAAKRVDFAAAVLFQAGRAVGSTNSNFRSTNDNRSRSDTGENDGHPSVRHR